MIPYDIGDPATYTGKAGTVPNQLAYKSGQLLVINDSPYQLRIWQNSSSAQYTVPPTSPRVVPLTPEAFVINWSVTATLAAANPALSDVALEFYEDDEEIPVFPMTFVRQANVGNVVSTTGTSVVINDGNPAPTVVVEGTPSGAGSSQLKLNNDGSAILGGGALTISNAGVVAGASIAGTEITGTVASATNATNLTGGSLTSTGAASLDGGTITTNGAGTISKVVEILWSAALSSGTKLMDLMQSYGFFSDNVGTGLGTTRTWLDGPDRGETHIGPRGSAWFDWIRLRATRVTVALGALSSPNALVFEVTGGPTHLDNAAITTDGSGNLTLGGKVASLGGIATAGSFGVPSIVAQALNVSVTDNASHTILSYTPAANGLYRANLYISNSDSSNPAVTASLVWKDVPFATLKDCQFAANPVFGGNLSVVLNGNTGISSGVMIACMPLVVYAAAGTAIQILYQVPAGTPSDRVTALLEHLA